MRYFTADLHIGDKAIARWRGFGEDVAAHDAYLLARLNARVAADDELWILGDVCRPRVESVAELRAAIACQHVSVVIGNHDERAKFLTAGGFETVDYYAHLGKVRREGYKFVLSHYPMLDWDRAYHGSYMLHGHIHSLPPEGAAAPEWLVGEAAAELDARVVGEGESADSVVSANAPQVQAAPRDSVPADRNHGGMGWRGYNEAMRDAACRRFDVGVDACGYAPVSADEIRAFCISDAEWTAAHGLPVD